MKYFEKITTILIAQQLLPPLLLLHSSLSVAKARSLDTTLKNKQQETNKVSPMQLRNKILYLPLFESSLTTTGMICPIDAFLDKTIYFPHDNICLKVDFTAEDGVLQGDITNPDCFNNEYVAMDTYSFLDSTGLDQKKDATFQFDGKGEGYSGNIEIKTSDVDKIKAIVVSKSEVMKTFQIDFLVPDCSGPPLMLYNTSSKKSKPISSDLR